MTTTRTIPIQIKNDNLATAILMAVLAGGVVWVTADVLAWGAFNILQGGEFSAGVKSAWHAIRPFTQGGEREIERVRAGLAANRPGWWLGVLTWTPRSAAVLAAIPTFFYFKKSLEKTFTADRHIRGRRVHEGQEALAAWARAEGQADGLRPHPSLPLIGTMREARHFLIVGGVGSGKTQTILPLIFAALARGDRLFVFDNKGDFTSFFPKRAARVAVILAPWDERSAIWDVARDVASQAAAREFAARMIIEPGGSSSPMWANASRQILVACLVELQAERPGAWGFADLVAKLTRPVEALTEAARRHFPEAVKALGDGQQNVTTAGIQINLMSYLSVIFDLARAWPKPPTAGRGFSVRDWLTNPQNPYQSVVIQHNGEFESQARAFNGAVLGLASQLINSPLVGESKTRRLWFFLDEFPQLGRVEAVFPLAEIGRSKGVRLVLGMQDFAQVKKIYSAEQTDTLLSMIGTHVIARVSAGETADYICKHLVGEREIERPELSTSGAVGQRSSRTQTTKIVREPVMLPAELSARLGPTKAGVKVMWLGLGGDALITELPYTAAQTHRPASIIAPWTQHPAPVLPAPAPAPIPAVSLPPQQQQPAKPAAHETGNPLPTKEKTVDTTENQNVVSTTEPASAGFDLLDDLINKSPLLKTDNPDGDEAGEGDTPAQNPLPAKAEIVDTTESQNVVSTPDPNKIILLPPASVTTTAAAEAIKEGLAEPLEKAAVHALAEVLPDPLGLLIQAGEIISDVQDAAALAPAPDVKIIPGEEQAAPAPERKKRRFKKKAAVEEMEQQP